jgi:HlyD family secretion protein
MLSLRATPVSQSNRPGKSGSSRLWAGLALAIAAVAAAAACFSYARSSGTDTAAYETRLASLGVVERTISASGPVKALVSVDVGSQLSGLITDMKVTFNDHVKQGDLLAVIDRAPFEARYASAAANLAIARGNVGLQEAMVTKAQHQLAKDERDAGRYRALAPSGSTSIMQLDQAETQSAVAREEYAIAKAQLESAKAAVAQREAELKQAEIDLNRTLIRSPINGVVIDRKMEQGQTVTADFQTPILFRLAQDLSQIQIWAQVDEADIGAVRPGEPVTFTVEAYPDETFDGTVEQLRLAAAKTGGVVTYTVIIRAKNSDQRLFPEMTATVRIVAGRRENVLSVPNEALHFRPPADLADGGASLWVTAADGALRRESVHLGLRGDASTEIVAGAVKAGDAVAVRARSPSSQRRS